jgi:hypothetical protein
MPFDPWAFEPPLGEFSRLVDWFSLVACVLGWVSCLWTLLRRRASRLEWVVWRRALLSGAVVGLGLLFAAKEWPELDPFVSLFISWVLGSAFGAGLVVLASRSVERRALGRRITEAVSLFVLGLPIPALAAVGAVRLMGR